jgi:hypothetical protein
MRSEVTESLGSGTEELPLKSVENVIEGEPSSFIVYHGSSEPFMTAIPSQEIPVMFYADRPDVAASYPWGKHLNEFLDELNKDKPSEFILAYKLLLTDEVKSNPLPAKQTVFSYDYLQPYQMNEPSVAAARERLDSDPEFRLEVEKFIQLREAYYQARGAKRSEVVEFETSPIGSVKEYLVESKNPAVFDFGGRTWGDIPDEENPGRWLVPTRRATTDDLRPLWDKWLNSFFDKGHDVVVIKNIRDVGDHFGETTLPHTTIAVSAKARVEVKAEK